MFYSLGLLFVLDKLDDRKAVDARDSGGRYGASTRIASSRDQKYARKGKRRAGESSVWYLFSRRAAAEIQAFNPEARILIMLREPAEMLYSLYYQFRFDGNEHLPTFEEALAAEDDRRAGRRMTRQTYLAQGLVYRDTARYTEQVGRYFDVFGRERVQVIIYDDLVADVRGVYGRVLEFLGVDSTRIEADFQVINGNKSVRHSTLRALLNDPLVRSTAVAVGRRLPRPFFAALHDVDRRLWKFNSRSEKRPPLAPKVRAQLQREFAPEVERLSELLGRDLTYWSRQGLPVAEPLPSPLASFRLSRVPASASCPQAK